jgi:hypothetical protein
VNGLILIPFSPALVPEIIRVWLEHKADVWFVWLLIATVALFVGILLDERAERFLPMKYRIADDGTVLEDEKRSGWQNKLRTFGFWLAVASIIGEGIFEFLGARAEGHVRDFADTRVTIATQQAADATRLAGNISNRADKLAELLSKEQETDERFQIQARKTEASLATATDDLRKATAQLDLVSRRRQPRGTLIHEAHIESDVRLRAFRGQGVAPIGCDTAIVDVIRPGAIASRWFSADPVTTERRETSKELAVGLMGAKWAVRGGAVGTMPCSTGGPNLRIWVDPAASDRTQLAAKAVASVLHDVLLFEREDDPPVSVSPIDAHAFQFLGIEEQEKTTTFLILVGDKQFE